MANPDELHKTLHIITMTTNRRYSRKKPKGKGILTEKHRNKDLWNAYLVQKYIASIDDNGIITVAPVGKNNFSWNGVGKDIGSKGSEHIFVGSIFVATPGGSPLGKLMTIDYYGVGGWWSERGGGRAKKAGATFTPTGGDIGDTIGPLSDSEGSASGVGEFTGGLPDGTHPEVIWGKYGPTDRHRQNGRSYGLLPHVQLKLKCEVKK